MDYGGYCLGNRSVRPAHVTSRVSEALMPTVTMGKIPDTSAFWRNDLEPFNFDGAHLKSFLLFVAVREAGGSG